MKALADKLHEESDEVAAAIGTADLVEELADIQQIVNDFCVLANISGARLEACRLEKFKRKGGFLDGQYVVKVTMPDETDKWVTYCRKQPQKYPQIDEKSKRTSPSK